jgi:hypothetical protein
MVERTMTAFGEDVVPRTRNVLDRDAVANRAAPAPALHGADRHHVQGDRHRRRLGVWRTCRASS